MKRIIFSVLISVMAVAAFGKVISDDKIPSIIRDRLYKDFPHAEIVRWEKTKEDNYKAEFWEENYYISAFYNPDGEFLGSALIIDWQNLPLNGRKEIQLLGKHRVVNVLRVTNSKNEVFYQIDYNRNLRMRQLLLDGNGKIIF